jgi:hypothetical protein
MSSQGFHTLDGWFDHHTKLGGWVGISFLDWNTLHNPLYNVVSMMEQYRALSIENVEQFCSASVTDNSIANRNVLEDASKIYYLLGEIIDDNLLYTPQVIHEPWHSRYRIHPGSGRAVALWLHGVEQFKAIYTHFNEPEFVAPPKTIKLHTVSELHKHLSYNNYNSMLAMFGIESYSAFPKNSVQQQLTSNKDAEWNPIGIHTNNEWQFLVYSEGAQFLEHKMRWRGWALDLWEELQHETAQLGSTILTFDAHDKVINVTRNGKVILDNNK